MAQGLTEQQARELIAELENMGLDSPKIDEILHVLDSVEPASGTPPLEGGGVSRSAIQIQMMNEPDWRKRAALAALLVSSEL
jgi:hypothetical protein